MQKMRIKAFKEFISDIEQGAFPSKENEVQVSDNLIKTFCNEIDQF